MCELPEKLEALSEKHKAERLVQLNEMYAENYKSWDEISREDLVYYLQTLLLEYQIVSKMCPPVGPDQDYHCPYCNVGLSPTDVLRDHECEQSVLADALGAEKDEGGGLTKAAGLCEHNERKI